MESRILEELGQLVQGKSEYHLVPDMERGLRVQTEPKSILGMKKQMKAVLQRPLHDKGLAHMENWLIRHFKSGNERCN